MLVELQEKVTPILLKTLFCAVPFLGLTHSYRAFRADKTLALAIKRVMGGKKTKSRNVHEHPDMVMNGSFGIVAPLLACT